MIKNLFGHVAIGDTPDVLKKIRTGPDINGAVLRQEPSAELRHYLQSLDLSNVVLKENFAKAYTYAHVDSVILFDPDKDDLESVGKILANGFPVKQGFEAFAADVTGVLKSFCEATGYQEVEGFFVLSTPQATGCWHHDNDTDIRGFKAYRSDGPLLRHNKTIPEELWRNRDDFYGMPDELELPDGTVSQLLEGDFGIWKGDVHERPLIHVKPAVDEGEFRLSMMINPLQRAYGQMLQEKGWKRFYKELSF